MLFRSNDTATTEIYTGEDTLSLHDALPISLVVVNRKIYFLLTTTKGFHFFSNMFENHALLIRSIVDKLDIEKVEVEVRNYLENPVERRSLIVICWVSVVIIAAFIVLKLLTV